MHRLLLPLRVRRQHQVILRMQQPVKRPAYPVSLALTAQVARGILFLATTASIPPPEVPFFFFFFYCVGQF
jgi:hypothetical protein